MLARRLPWTVDRCPAPDHWEAGLERIVFLSRDHHAKMLNLLFDPLIAIIRLRVVAEFIEPMVVRWFKSSIGRHFSNETFEDGLINLMRASHGR
jgi:hypothetical protein